jgi:large subunit ribosomal protein L15
VPLYRKIPVRGFTRGRFEKPSTAVTLATIEAYFDDGETVNIATLREKGLVPRLLPGGLKVLGNGALKKKVTIEAHRFSASAKEKLDSGKISYTVLA